jgi:hypothetical protein
MRLRFRKQPEAHAVTEAPRYVIAFEAFGVPFDIELSSPELAPRVQTALPPGARPIDTAPQKHRFGLLTNDGLTYGVVAPGNTVPGSSDVDIALEILASQLRSFVAAKAPNHVFVHAGVVERDGQAVMIPGPTFSGKTSLVAEFVRAGATYYSDEFAVLDADGLVHPYAKPLSIRTNGVSQVDHDVSLLGGVAGSEPLPVGLIILSGYLPGAVWDPQSPSPGEAVLALLSNTVTAEERPAEALSIVRKAVDGAVVLEGPRGEAAQVVEQLFEGLPV